ncbi:hypothetical protein [Streptomyces sp. C3-3]|uniref:hypothetical protein n=1 Tax=Streptomyces sp. C3-3 TaxID=2824901 RepID=UPI001B39AE85|nr:hypothetical protein [Streptomyces sp. C3-3]MBQ1118535.1 hypothetical protein [Streptomyces sp. C3-3]
MTRQLTTQNATITTAAVEVKTLTISGKQVTLAVFRQLKEEPLIAEDGTLNGEPWGSVNYHPDKCSAAAEHLHVVWQKGTELRRAYVDGTPNFDRVLSGGYRVSADWYSSVAANRYLTALVYMGLKTSNESILDSRPPSFATRHATHLSRLDFPEELSQAETFSVRATVPQDAVDAADLASAYIHAQTEADVGGEGALSSGWQKQTVEQRQEEVSRLRVKYDEAMSALRAMIEKCGGFDAIGDAYTAEIAAEEERRRRHHDVHASLAKLPQLFIAV